LSFTRHELIGRNTYSGAIELSAFILQHLRLLAAIPKSKASVVLLRPFGKKEGIDFESVQSLLIEPALRDTGVHAVRTAALVEAGDIRQVVLSQLLSADLVIADVSLADANVFYQLGIRHSLRDSATLIIRSTSGPYSPFDLRTDRFISYDAGNPAAGIYSLSGAVSSILASATQDSPVFRVLPDLQPVSRARLQTVPPSFREELALAGDTRSGANLRLLSREVSGLTWEPEALRLVAREQFRRGFLPGAVESLERFRTFDPDDARANLMLATVHQRTGNLDASDKLLDTVLASRDRAQDEIAETLLHLARNMNERWRRDWQSAANTQEAALRSSWLSAALQRYTEALQQDLNSFWAALNALALVTIRIELARMLPDVWIDCFDSEEEAAAERTRDERLRQQLAATAELALLRPRQSSAEQEWIQVSQADLLLYSGARPARVAYAYERAFSQTSPFVIESAARNLTMFRDLDIHSEAVARVLEKVPHLSPQLQTTPTEAVLFVGHVLDFPDRPDPRFPPAGEGRVWPEMLKAVAKIREAGENIRGVAGATAGADILFHEACLQHGIPVTLCLPYPPDEYLLSSVQYAGSEWVGRFHKIIEARSRAGDVSVMANSAQLPDWLREKPHYSVWRRNLHWMIASAQEIGAGKVHLLALWDKVPREGYGGVSDFVHQAQSQGFPTTVLDLRQILE
jgi:hypothetical protein